VVLSDLNLLILGAYCFSVGNRGALPQPVWWFFLRRFAGLAMGIVAVIVYRAGLLGFMWTMFLAAVVSLPELAYRFWQDFRAEVKSPTAPQEPE
jgi:hypothetical protein